MNKTRIILTVAAGLLLFALGRYSASLTSQQTVTKDDTHTVVKRVTVRTKQPNGSVQTVVTENRDVTERSTETARTVAAPKQTLSISGLAGVDITNKLLTPVYGLSITKQVVGPITAGAFGMTSGVVGLSLGVNF